MMVAVTATFDIPQQEELCLVSQRKYNLDPGRPWWAKAYFKYVYLPVVRFGFRRMQVPGPAAMQPDGRIEIIEQAKLCIEPADAEKFCQEHGELFTWKPIPLDTEMPAQSVQYGGHRTPGSLLPDRFRRRSFPGVALGTHRQVKELTATLESISRTARGQ